MAESNKKSLCIVGGGSAGWMTAVYLNKLFNHSQQNFDITVVESPDIGIIGVGEATVHSVRYFFAAMGLDEFELLNACNGSLKLGIMFRNWMKPVNGEMHAYFHPFEQQQLGRTLDISSTWFASNRQARERYDEGVSLSTILANAGHGPKGRSSPAYQGVVPYGYHIDAVLLARFLRDKGTAAGINHIEATIESVETHGQTIKSVKSTDGRSFAADYFVDCTGFRSMLIDAVSRNNWNSFEDALPCNRAVAIQRDLREGEAPKPYTVATALSNGWAWEIGLSNRQGTGYVYAGDQLSEGEAEAELLEFLGEDTEVLKCKHLKMKIGCREEFWVGNVVATGLSGGFIEPLESTGLHLINLAAGLMGTHLASKEVTQAQRDSFNRLMRGFYQDLKQFIVLHYCLTNRDDTEFWRGAPATVEHCDWLKNQLEIWKHKICEFHDLAGSFSTTFSDENYRYILYGMQHYPDLKMNMLEDQSAEVFARLEQMGQNALSVTMGHLDYLDMLRVKHAS